MIEVTHFTDPGCPWAYSASPAHAVLRWRFGDQLQWRLVLIGLTEQAEQYVRRGYTPAGSARGYLRFRHRGMPFATQPRARIAATGLRLPRDRRHPAAGARVRAARPSARCSSAGSRRRSCSTIPTTWRSRCARVDGLDVDAVLAALDSPEVEDAYQADRAEARTAEGTPTEAQGKAAQTDGDVRYTAPSLIFSHEGQQLEAGGFQPVEAYDVLLANLDPTLERRPPPEDPLEALAEFSYGLTTYEVAAIMTPNNGSPDPAGAEAALIDHVADGEVIREPLGDGALWRAGPYPPRRRHRSGPARTAPDPAAASRR